jgi:hypothetical protein
MSLIGLEMSLCAEQTNLKFSAYNPSYFISFSQQAQSWNIYISNAKKKKKNPGHLYLTFFTGLPVTLNTLLFF